MRRFTLVLICALGLFMVGCGESEESKSSDLGDQLKQTGEEMQEQAEEVKDEATEQVEEIKEQAQGSGNKGAAAQQAVDQVLCAADHCTAQVSAEVEKVDDHGFCCPKCRVVYLKDHPQV